MTEIKQIRSIPIYKEASITQTVSTAPEEEARITDMVPQIQPDII